MQTAPKRRGYPKPLVTFEYPRRLGTPRPAETYRGARRNVALVAGGPGWPGVAPTRRVEHPPVQPNRRDRDGIMRRTMLRAMKAMGLA